MPDLGIQLQLFMGPTLPVPTPFAVTDALVSAEVTDNDRDRNGFQLTFRIGKDTPLDYSLLASGLFDPPSRLALMVIVNGQSKTLIDGVITTQQLAPSNKPGETTLHITGEDVSVMMDLEEKSATFPNQSDSSIVQTLLGAYVSPYGVKPKVTPTTDVPDVPQRVPNQQGTDLSVIRSLAQKNGFVFYVAALAPGSNTAYWGPDNRNKHPQPALSMNMGPETNVDAALNFQFNALGPVQPQVSYLDPDTQKIVILPVPSTSSLHPPLSRQPVVALRKSIPRNVANKTEAQAQLVALSTAIAATDAVTVSGQVDTVRYGWVLQSAGLVGVRGVGQTFDGLYYVQRVTHQIKRGSYTQSFSLTREGRGALSPVVGV